MESKKEIPLFIVGRKMSELSGIPTYKNMFLDRDDFDLDMEAKIFLNKSDYFKSIEPSRSHFRLADIVQATDGIIVTQNLDGLLEKSDIDPSCISHTEVLLDHPEEKVRIYAYKSLEELLGDSRVISEVYMIGVDCLDGLNSFLIKDVPYFYFNCSFLEEDSETPLEKNLRLLEKKLIG